MGSYSKFNDMHMDVMREIGNIGAGNACTALSSLLGRMIDMSVPNVQLVDSKVASEYLGGTDNVVLGIRVDVKVDLTGMMFHVVNKKFAEKIINTFYPKELTSVAELDDMDASVLNEMANITSGAYASAIASLAGFVVDIGTPSQTSATVKDILMVPVNEIGNGSDQIIVIDETFIMNEEQLKSNMILVLDPESLEKLFNKLGVAV